MSGHPPNPGGRRRAAPDRNRRPWAAARRIVPAAVSGLALAVLLAFNERARAGVMVFSWPAGKWAVVFLLLVSAAALAGRLVLKPPRDAAPGNLPASLPFAVLLAGCVVFLFSGATLHPWSYYLGWMPAGVRGWANWRAGLALFIFLTAVMTPFFFRRRRLGRGLFVLLAAAQIASFYALLRTTGGAALYRDDHPSFMFRLWEFSSTFPQYLNYNPWWNGGAANAYCTSSGTGALGLPLFPLWKFFPVHRVYTIGVGLIYILALPLMAAVSLRVMGAGRSAAACAGLLALGVSRHFFLWLLHYGTICAPLVAFFVLPVAACLYRVFWLGRREKWLAAALVVSALMLLQWPPGLLMLAPIGFAVLVSCPRWSGKKIRFVLICAGIVLVLWFRQFLVILLKGRTVVSHVVGGEAAAEPLTMTGVLEQGYNYLLAHLQEGHPVLIFLGLAAVFVLPVRSVRRWFGPALLGFVVIVGWGPQVLPNLELGRMAIPMMFLAVGPAAVSCSRLLRGSHWLLAPARAGLIVLLGLGAWNVANLYGNRSSARYSVMGPEINEFAARLRREVPEGGRVMFAGPTVHYFGRGHVAYLPYLTGREMMAVDYYHFPPTYVKYEYPPDGFNESPEAVLRFIRLYNITHVVTYHDRWKSFFRKMVERADEVEGYEVVRASVFRIRREPSLFLRGAGRVEAGFSRLDVRVEDPAREAVICYNWADGLSAPDPVELFPFDAGGGIRLIGIRPNGRPDFQIRYRSLL